MKHIKYFFILVISLAFNGLAVADTKSDYETKCTACHGFGVAGAPKLDDAANWEPRIAKGVETLYENAINGFTGDAGVMPAKGGFADLTDDQIKALVDYMLEQVQQ